MLVFLLVLSISYAQSLVISNQQVNPSSTSTFAFSSGRSGSFYIGSDIFSVKNVYACNSPPEGTYTPPQPDANCYQGEIIFSQFSGVLKHGDIKTVNNYISFKYTANGNIISRSSGLENNLNGNLLFTINNPLKVQVVGICLDKVTLKVTNNLPPHLVDFKISQKALRVELNLPDQTLQFPLNTGDNTVVIPLNTQNLGINEVTIETFYPIKLSSPVLLSGDSVYFLF